MSSAPPPRFRRRSLLAGIPAAGLIAGLASGCSLKITSKPDPSIGDDTLLIAGDKGEPTFTANFNPYQPNKRVAATLIYEPLIWINPLDGELKPWLAQKWDQPDPATITMDLVEDATWTDGTPLTAKDVAYTFQMLKDFPANDINGVWGRIDSVDTDGNTVTFALKDADSPALSVLGKTYIVPEHIWSTIDDPTQWRNEHPVGSGPFTLGSFTNLQYSLDRYDGYWQADSIDIGHLVYPAATDEMDLVTKGYDWGYAFMSDVEKTWGGANAHNKFWFPPGGIIGMHPNHDKKPFGDVNVRKGLALAIDGSAVADVASEGHMKAASQTGLLLPNQEDVLDPSIPDKGIITKDKDASIKAFEKAGFSYDGSTMKDPDGKPFTFTLSTANGYTDWLRAAQQIQRELKDVGIEITIDAPQPAAYEASLTSGDYEVAIASSGGADVFQGYDNLLSGEYYKKIGENTQNNRIRFRDKDVDDLLNRYRKSVDEDEQTEILRGIEKIFYEKLPIITVYYGGLWGLYNDGRFEGWPTADDPYAPLQTYDSSPLMVLTKLRRVKKGAQE